MAFTVSREGKVLGTYASAPDCYKAFWIYTARALRDGEVADFAHDVKASSHPKPSELDLPDWVVAELTSQGVM